MIPKPRAGRQHRPARQRAVNQHRAEQQNGFAQRDDEDLLVALQQVQTLQRPAVHRRRALSGQPEAQIGRAVIHQHRDDPELQPVGGNQRAGDPEKPRERAPRAELGVVPAHRLAAKHQRHVARAQKSHHDIGAHEQTRAPLERVGDRHGHQDRAGHQRDHQETPGGVVRIDPVRGPCGVVPRPPDGGEERGGLNRAGPRHVLQQEMRELDDREDVNEIEKQLHVRHAHMRSGRAGAQGGGRSEAVEQGGLFGHQDPCVSGRKPVGVSGRRGTGAERARADAQARRARNQAAAAGTPKMTSETGISSATLYPAWITPIAMFTAVAPSQIARNIGRRLLNVRPSARAAPERPPEGSVRRRRA